MKKYRLYLLALCTFLLFSNAKAQTLANSKIIVSGELSYLPEGKRTLEITYRVLDAGKPTFDSCSVIDGKFKFEKEIKEPVSLTIALKGNSGLRGGGGMLDYNIIFLTPGESKIVAKDRLANAIVTGPGGIYANPYMDFIKKLNEHDRDLRSKLASLKSLIDPVLTEKRTNEVTDSMNNLIYVQTIKNNPSSPIAAAVLTKYAGEPVWTPRKKMVPLEIEKLLNSLSKTIQDYPSMVALKKELQVAKATGIGKPIIDFALKDRNGKTVKLSNFKGKYVFLDFWASWCVPCRKENPNVKAQFEKYKDKGFTVLSVSMDKAEARQDWLDAIKKDEIDLWTHLIDEEGFKGKAASSYYVQSIPTNFLISPEGKFLGRNLYGEDLNKALVKILDNSGK